MTIDPQERLALARDLVQQCRIRGDFVLRSGQHSDEYFDKYQFESDPALLARVAQQLAPLVPPGTDVLAGLELGGIPLATALSLATGLPAAFVRKEAKTYGTARLAEGAVVAGARCLIIEDVVTTGGQIVTSTGQLRDAGAIVEDALCVVDRSGNGAPALAAAGLRFIALFTRDELTAASPPAPDDTLV